MFTGIIEGQGTITAIQPSGTGRRLTVTTGFDLTHSRVGDSIAVNGACLTAVVLGGRRFAGGCVPGNRGHGRPSAGAGIGERVNLERALRLCDRIDGHLVSGHIDGMGVLSSRQKKADGNADFDRLRGVPAALIALHDSKRGRWPWTGSA